MVNHPNRKKTPALMKALRAVRDGLVTNVFTPTGNKFEGPDGIHSSSYRRLQILKWIEDVPGHRGGVYTTRVQQRPTKDGLDALSEPS